MKKTVKKPKLIHLDDATKERLTIQAAKQGMQLKPYIEQILEQIGLVKDA